MNPERVYVDFLNDILESIEKIEQFISNMDYQDFVKDDKTNYAVIRAFEIIGEASKEIPDELKEEYDEIPWKEMDAMRDKLIHSYFGVDLEVVWKTIEEDISTLKPLIQKIIEKEDN